MFVIGIACAGKTTVARHLRESSDLNVVDLDDAIGRLNGGVWPDIPTKNNVVVPKALAEVRAMSDVVLFGSLNVEQTQKLRQDGFYTVLLDVSRMSFGGVMPCGFRRRDGRMCSGSSTSSR